MQPISNILCASPDLIKKYGTPNTVKDLFNYPFISHSLRKLGTKLPLENGTYVPHQYYLWMTLMHLIKPVKIGLEFF